MPGMNCFNTPEGVEGFSSLRGVMTYTTKCWPEVLGFNTPEGVEGFSRLPWPFQGLTDKALRFQYPGGC